MISRAHTSVWLRNLPCVLLLGLGLASNVPALAEDSRFPLTAPEEKRLIVEHVYQFYVMRYDPPVEVRVLETSPRKAAYNPDLTAIAFLSAQAQGNYEWYVKLLSETRRKQLKAELARTGKTPQALTQEWRKRFANRRVVLTHRVVRGMYCIIRYQVIDPEKKEVVERGDLPITVMLERGRAWAVADLTGDLIFENWDFPGAIKRMTKERN